MRSIAEKSFGFNLRLLKLFYFYPRDNYSRTFIVKAQFFHLIMVCPAPVFSILHLILDTNINMERVNYNAAFIVQSSAFIIKYLPFVYNSYRFQRCINLCDSLFLHKLTATQKTIVEECIRSCRNNSAIFFAFCVGAVTSWGTKPYFWSERYFPVDIWLPFDAIQNSYVYTIIYVFMLTGQVRLNLFD